MTMNSSKWKKIQIWLLLSKSVLSASKILQLLLHLQRKKLDKNLFYMK